ncbi:MAG TPA: hypothetical protein VKD67_04515, partial [Acidimicrobiales bacterium]|nr:hypothetical protein [Acidimicrobiales bacterium]
MLGAGVALGVTELVSGFGSASKPGVVTTVANRFVDLTAGSLRDFAVSEFGSNDKAALLIGIVLIALGIGALVGPAAARRRWVGRVVFAVFALVGIFSGWTDPQASFPVTAIASILGGIAGVATLELMLWLGRTATVAEATAPGAQDPRVKAADRRTFLLAAGGVGAFAAVAAIAGRGVRGAGPATKSRATIT